MIEPEIISETANYFVINKPPYMAVEPPSDKATLADWLVENRHIKKEDWQESERLGVVHRLDGDTSGVMIWAKNSETQSQLKTLWQGRAVKKTYIALLIGECPEEGSIELSLQRDNKNDRQTVAWLPNPKSRPAITTYRRLAVGNINGMKVSLVEAHPVTGRTHQLRVHFKAINHPIIGDKLYGEKESQLAAKSSDLNRQFLHALEICLPEESGEKCYRVDLPKDLQQTLATAAITYP